MSHSSKPKLVHECEINMDVQKELVDSFRTNKIRKNIISELSNICISE